MHIAADADSCHMCLHIKPNRFATGNAPVGKNNQSGGSAESREEWDVGRALDIECLICVFA